MPYFVTVLCPNLFLRNSQIMTTSPFSNENISTRKKLNDFPYVTDRLLRVPTEIRAIKESSVEPKIFGL